MKTSNHAPTIRVEGNGFTLDPGALSVALDDISAVTFFKYDQWTIDLICCELSVRSAGLDQSHIVDEEMPGWNDLIELLARLPGFDCDWYAKVAQPPFAENRTTVFLRPG